MADTNDPVIINVRDQTTPTATAMPAQVVIVAPPPQRALSARLALAMAAAVGGECMPPNWLRPPSHHTKCAHSFGIAGGFSSCTVCGINPRHRR